LSQVFEEDRPRHIFKVLSQEAEIVPHRCLCFIATCSKIPKKSSKPQEAEKDDNQEMKRASLITLAQEEELRFFSQEELQNTISPQQAGHPALVAVLSQEFKKHLRRQFIPCRISSLQENLKEIEETNRLLGLPETPCRNDFLEAFQLLLKEHQEKIWSEFRKKMEEFNKVRFLSCF